MPGERLSRRRRGSDPDRLRTASALGPFHPYRETAAVLYRRAVDEEFLPRRSIQAMSAAGPYVADRRHDTPRTIDSLLVALGLAIIVYSLSLER